MELNVLKRFVLNYLNRYVRCHSEANWKLFPESEKRKITSSATRRRFALPIPLKYPLGKQTIYKKKKMKKKTV